MARLFSTHDKYHSHAVLGLLALLHFAYRFFSVLIQQRESFTQNVFSAGCLLIHVFLHVLSFQFDLPRNRIWTKPMIWREFRVHNAIFAFRHLIATALGIWAPEWWWQNPGVLSMSVKVLLVWSACKAADVATEKIGSTEDRTTNSMPYPKQTPDTIEQVAKRFYAKSQFAATALAVFGPPSACFLAVFAIEIASFLMTLVRKGLIEDRTYHMLYALSLFVMFPVLVATLHSGRDGHVVATLRSLTACALAIDLRMKYRLGKYTTWAAAIISGLIVGEIISTFAIFKWVFAWAGMLWSAYDTLRSFYMVDQKSKASADAPEGKESSQEISNASPVVAQPVEGLDGSSAKEADTAGHSFPYVTPSLG